MSKILSVSKEPTAEEKNKLMGVERTAMKTLFEAATSDSLPLFKDVVLKYMNVEDDAIDVLSSFKDGRGRTALHFAAQAHSLNCLTYIFEQMKLNFDDDKNQALINYKDDSGCTALMCACMNTAPTNTLPSNFSLTVKLLLQNKAAALLCTKTGASALHYASQSGIPEIVQSLLKVEGIRSLAGKGSEGGTPLHWAAASAQPRSPEIIKLLVNEELSDVNAVDGRGLPCVVLACASSLDSNAAALIKEGADCGMIMSGNVTLAHIAADCGLLMTMKELIKTAEGKKCIVLKNDSGETPIELAAEHGYIECVRALMAELYSGEKVDDGAVNDCIAKIKADNINKPKITEADVQKKKDEDKAKSEGPQIDPTEADAAIRCSVEMERAETVTESAQEDAKAEKALGNASYSKSDWKAAISHYTKAIEIFPADATFYSNRSACYINEKEYTKALSDAIFVRVIKPDWVKGCYRLAKARLELGRFEDAAVAAWSGIQMESENEELKALLKRCVKKGKQQHLESVKEGSR